MSTTPNLDLPLILPGQAQKHITHNEALAALDLIAQLVVLDRTLATPPADLPAEGLRYIVPPGATGVWAGKDNQIAAVVDGVWQFIAPHAGWLAYSLAESGLVAFSGTGWAPVLPPVVPQTSAPQFGINTVADATNRLAVKTGAALFSAEDAEGASGDIRMILNRTAAADTASLLFQTGWSGRAELGLAGDDRFRLKVSANGTAWTDAMAVETASGNIGFGTAAPQARVDVTRNSGPLPAPPAPTLVRLAGADATDTREVVDAFGATATTNYRRANGTARAPESLVAGDVIGGMVGWGYAPSGYSSNVRAGVRFVTTERWTDSGNGTGIYFSTTANGTTLSTERMRLSSGGNLGLGTANPTDKLAIIDDIGAAFRATVYASVPADGTVLRCVRARGTMGAPAAVNAGDRLAGLAAYGHDGTNQTGSRADLSIWAEEGFTPSGHGTSLRLSTTGLGTTQAQERLRIAPDGSLIHRGNTQTIVDAASHLRLRPYPSGSLPPAAAAGTLIYVTNAPNNRGLAVSDGATWRFADGTIAA